MEAHSWIARREKVGAIEDTLLHTLVEFVSSSIAVGVEPDFVSEMKGCLSWPLASPWYVLPFDLTIVLFVLESN